MTQEVVTAAPQTTAAEALALCRGNRIRHLPVLQGGRLVGVISDRDLRAATPALGDPARAEALDRIRVADEMARDVVTARPEDPIEDAAMTMYERKIGCLPVVDGEDLVGIVTSSDVLRALVPARRRARARQPPRGRPPEPLWLPGRGHRDHPGRGSRHRERSRLLRARGRGRRTRRGP
ncbi:MAG: CBS domain-containing protein [Actinobacteria bacterium]|nr:CBS domain-containing protein [Actinomycetota bacterium]